MPNIPKGAKTPTDRLSAEVKAEEASAEGEFVTVEFKGVPLRVLPFLDWDKDAVAHLNTLNIGAWAPLALHPADVTKFNKIKATLRETLPFIKEAAAQGGGDLGEFLAS